MRPGWAARSCIREVERYRRRGAGRGSGCRFHPSCSSYALEALRTRSFPAALWMVAWRVLRCNPLVSLATRDPVTRDRRLRPRPNAVATGSTVFASTGLLVIGLTTLAFAQGVTGGCTATVNGVDPASMTRSDPLVVSEGQFVRVDGVVPASAQALPEDQVQSTTVIKVSGIEDVFGFSSESRPGQGYAWGGQVSVDDYLKWGVGLYRVEGTASGTPGWACTGSGYVKLDGNPLSKPVGQAAAGVTVVGAVGAVASALPKRKPGPGAPPAARSAEEVKEDFARDADRVLGITPVREPLLDVGVSFGCAVLLVLAFLGIGQMGSAAVAVSQPGRGRTWAHGRPVAGFVAGVLLGLGITVLLQQYAIWPLTIATGIVFPVLAGVLTAARAWLGRPYRTEFRSRHDST
ncbi:MAG: membrane protein insertion efficiency factor YidD [Actinomycetota bacterium]